MHNTRTVLRLQNTRSLLRIIALCVASLAVAVAVAGWLVLGGIERLGTSGATSADTFETLRETLDLTVETSLSVRDGLADLDALVETVASSSATTATFIGDVADLTATRIPASIMAVEQAMPGLVEAATVIDDTLSTLALFGVTYRPEVPFDEALRDIQRSLDGLAGDVAAQGVTLHRLVPEVQRVGTTASELGERIRDTRGQVHAAAVLLADYRGILTETEHAVSATTEPLRHANLLRLLFVATGLVGLALGWALWQISNDPEAVDVVRAPEV